MYAFIFVMILIMIIHPPKKRGLTLETTGFVLFLFVQFRLGNMGDGHTVKKEMNHLKMCSAGIRALQPRKTNFHRIALSNTLEMYRNS